MHKKKWPYLCPLLSFKNASNVLRILHQTQSNDTTSNTQHFVITSSIEQFCITNTHRNIKQICIMNKASKTKQFCSTKMVSINFNSYVTQFCIKNKHGCKAMVQENKKGIKQKANLSNEIQYQEATTVILDN
jgi:hypothetical protein